MLQRKRLILVAILFFLLFNYFYGTNQLLSLNFSQSNILGSSYPVDPINGTNAIVEYNVLTKSEEIYYFNKTIGEQSFQTTVKPFLGNNDYRSTLEIENLEVSYPFPPDNRVMITSTTNYPWSTICKLYIKAADDTTWSGTGVMIDAFHMLTAGHLVYLHDNGGWISEMTVVPGMSGNQRPFGQAIATYYRSYTGWTQDESPRHDWALITLDRPIGNQSGWMETMTADISDPIYLGTLHTAGYPGDLDSGEYMYYDSDVGEKVDEFNHWYWMDTAGGQSGSPIWTEVNGTNYILTINAYEYESGSDANFGTRLNQDKFDQLITWLATDPPPDYNPNELNPNLIIFITIIALVGVAVLIGGTVIALKKSRPKLQLVEPNEENYTQYGLEEWQSLNQPLLSQVFGFCPNCGKQIFRETQRFCSNCGFDLFNISSD